MEAKFGLKSYYEPTPKLFRKIGDGILYSSTAISGAIAGMDIPHKEYWMLGITIIGTLGKFISNMFSDSV